jgi:hypothetical protein
MEMSGLIFATTQAKGELSGTDWYDGLITFMLCHMFCNQNTDDVFKSHTSEASIFVVKFP